MPTKIAALVAHELIGKHCQNQNPFDINVHFAAMRSAQRNYGAEGIRATALSADDIALWDLKAKLLNQPLASLPGAVRKAAPVYGSGGFTTYTDTQLRKQLSGWIPQGIPRGTIGDHYGSRYRDDLSHGHKWLYRHNADDKFDSIYADRGEFYSDRPQVREQGPAFIYIQQVIRWSSSRTTRANSSFISVRGPTHYPPMVRQIKKDVL